MDIQDEWRNLIIKSGFKFLKELKNGSQIYQFMNDKYLFVPALNYSPQGWMYLKGTTELLDFLDGYYDLDPGAFFYNGYL